VTGPRRLILLALEHAPLLLLAGVLLAFGAVSPRFLCPQNLVDLLVQSASVGIVATGMTIVLLSGGIDLSVGALMYVAAAAAGLLLRNAGAPVAIVLPLMLLIGVTFGAVNGLLVAGLRLLPFVVTLATLYAGRGLALWMTQTKAMNLTAYLSFGAGSVLGVPMPVWMLLGVMAAAHVLLAHTPWGRQLYALGHDREAARKAGVATGRVLFTCYVLSGLCAAGGAIVSLTQLGAVSQKFGLGVEFEAIAAAALGGTSLFGGRGKVLPGTLAGAVLLRAIYSGLVMMKASEYAYPLVTSAIVFLAVLIDVGRTAAMKRLAGAR